MLIILIIVAALCIASMACYEISAKLLQEKTMERSAKKRFSRRKAKNGTTFQSYVLLYCKEQQHVIRIAQSHFYRLWGVSRHGPLNAAYASRAGSPL